MQQQQGERSIIALGTLGDGDGDGDGGDVETAIGDGDGYVAHLTRYV